MVRERPGLSEFFRDKKVLITGHTGFKGAWMTVLLKELGAKIKGYALAPENENDIFNVIWNDNIGESIIGDIRDKDKLENEIGLFQPDFIFHLAAQPLVRESYKRPSETFEVNVVGTANLLESIIGLNKKCTVVIITTDKVYRNKEVDILYSEDDVLGGYDPYSASKACTELVVSSFRDSFFNVKNYNSHQKSIVSARAGNVIGGGDWNKDRLLPDIVRALEEGTEIKIRNPYSVRPWQHVLEPLTGYLLLAQSVDQLIDFSGAYNFGPLPIDHIPVKELVDIAIETWKYGKWVDISDPASLHEAQLLQLSIEKAQRELQWSPKLTVRQSIEWAVNWYKKPHPERLDFTFQQVKHYLSL